MPPWPPSSARDEGVEISMATTPGSHICLLPAPRHGHREGPSPAWRRPRL